MKFFLATIILAAAVSISSNCRAANATFDLSTFGAKCDGVTDDTSAIQNWLNSASDHTLLRAPAGACIFTAALTTPAVGVNFVSIVGAGPHTTTFRYAGPSTSIDLITIGNGSASNNGWLLQGFQISSATKMTGGAGLHIKRLNRSEFLDVIWDGQDGTGNLWNGVWFDQIDEDFVDGFEARGQNDALRVNGAVGSGPKAGLFLSHGKIAGSGVGIRQGGAFGGLAVDATDVINNGINVSIDNSLANEGNREVFFGANSNIDSATNGPGIVINDGIAGAMTVSLAGWIATGNDVGVYIQRARGAKISISGPAIWNFKSDGVKIDDASAFVQISTATLIHDNGGYGVNATSATDLITPGAMPRANGQGAYSPLTHISSLANSSGYQKFANGNIHQWGIVTFSGAANSILNPNEGYPISLPVAFPNATIQSTIIATPTGFANRAAQMTVTASPYDRTGLYINLVSSGQVSNTQAVKYDVWGY